MGCTCGGGGGSTTTQTQSSQIPKYMQDYGKFLTEEAKSLYENNQPSYYPESTVVGPSPYTQEALTGIADRATTGSPLEGMAQDLTAQIAMSNPMQGAYGQQALMDTAAGNFLGGNPYYDQMVSQAVNPVIANVQSAMSKAGRLGSGANTDILADSIGDITSRLAYQNYSAERQNQLGAAGTLGNQFLSGLGYQTGAINALPEMANIDYSNLNKLLGAGSMREQYDQQQLGDAVNRYNFEQMTPWDSLGRIQNIMAGQPYQSTTTNTSSSDPGFLGTAGSLAGIGGNLAMMGLFS